MLVPGNNWFKCLLQRLNISNVVNEPSTHFTTDTGTCFDLVLTNDIIKVKNVIVYEPICSIHSTVTVEISFLTYKQQAFHRIVRNYNMEAY